VFMVQDLGSRVQGLGILGWELRIESKRLGIRGVAFGVELRVNGEGIIYMTDSATQSASPPSERLPWV
jgi:hypothetical protein